MKYGQTIRDLAARGQNWRFYDENFRFLRGTQASLVPWRSIHGELWLRSQFPAKALLSSSQVMEFYNLRNLFKILSEKCRPVINRNNYFTIVCSYKLGLLTPTELDVSTTDPSSYKDETYAALNAFFNKQKPRSGLNLVRPARRNEYTIVL